MTLQLPIELANQVLGYLGTRPYQEVFQLIQAILQIKKTNVGADNASRIKSGWASKNLCELRNLDVIWHNRNHKNIQVQGAIHVLTPCRQKRR